LGTPPRIRRLRDRLDEVFSEFSWEPQEFIDAGNAVVVAMRFHARGRESGVETVSRGAGVYWFRTAKLCGISNVRAAPTPSKPPGCGSSQARYRGAPIHDAFV
jgi:hypothetical protein